MSDSTRNKAKSLVNQMTMEEKISQMVYQSPAIERLNIPAYNWWNESLHGVARAGVATMFPQAISMAATFDKEFIHTIADVISTEGRAKNREFIRKNDRGIYKGLTYWAPNVNIFRDPRWGRGHETFGEDPYLTSELGVAYIKGIQGEDADNLKAAACAKHFAVHSGPEATRHSFDAKVSKKDLYETYLYAFYRCVKDGKVEAVMGAYNRVNGEPACGSKTLLTDILRKDWGFEGHVVSDCWAILDFHEHHHVTDTVKESAAMAVNNGCDLNCGSAFLYLYQAFKDGLVTEEAINQSVVRLLDTRIRLGMLHSKDSPYDLIPYDKVECREHRLLSIECAKRGTVLLKNKNLLPLKKENLHTIGVIGPNANSREGLIGNYTGTASLYITPLQGIQTLAGDTIRVLYAEGAHLYKDRSEPLAEQKDRFAEAITVAEQSEVIILCLGLDATIEGEEGDTGNAYASGDKVDLLLPGNQQALLERVCEVGKPVVLLLSTGSAMDISWADEKVDAILQTWYPGAYGGEGIAALLFGVDSPCGRLPITFYRNSNDLPSFSDYAMKNRTYRYMTTKPLYPFGYGLTYTDIQYIEVSCSRTCFFDAQDCIFVSAKVLNTGNYKVHEVVQVYIRDEEASVTVPNWSLRGIQVVPIEPNTTKDVTLKLEARDFALITNEGECVLEPGSFLISLGGQQPDARSEELTGKACAVFRVEYQGKRTRVAY